MRLPPSRRQKTARTPSLKPRDGRLNCCTLQGDETLRFPENRRASASVRWLPATRPLVGWVPTVRTGPLVVPYMQLTVQVLGLDLSNGIRVALDTEPLRLHAIDQLYRNDSSGNYRGTWKCSCAAQRELSSYSRAPSGWMLRRCCSSLYALDALLPESMAGQAG